MHTKCSPLGKDAVCVSACVADKGRRRPSVWKKQILNQRAIGQPVGFHKRDPKSECWKKQTLVYGFYCTKVLLAFPVLLPGLVFLQQMNVAVTLESKIPFFF